MINGTVKDAVAKGAHSVSGPAVIGGALLAVTSALNRNRGWDFTPEEMGMLALAYGWLGARAYAVASAVVSALLKRWLGIEEVK